MESVIFVEVLDRHGRVKDRVKLQHFPVTIGTAYSNDVILDDRYAAAHEACIELDEQSNVLLRDSGSVNGIVNRSSKQKVDQVALTSGDEFHLGHTDIRIMFVDHPVPDAVVIKAGMFGVAGWANNFLWLMAIALVSFVGLAINEYFTQVGKFSTVEFAENLLSFLLGLLFVAGVWAMGTRLVSHEFRIFQHLAVICVVMLIGTLIDNVFGYFDFIFSPDAYFHGMTLFIYCLIGVAWLFIHLCVVSRQAVRAKFFSSFLLVGVVFGMVQLQSSLIEEDNTGALEFSYTIKSHGQGMIHYVSMDELFSESHSLKTKLDLDVKEQD